MNELLKTQFKTKLRRMAVNLNDAKHIIYLSSQRYLAWSSKTIRNQ